MRSLLYARLAVVLLMAALRFAASPPNAGLHAQASAPQTKPLDPAAWGDDHVGKPAPELAGGDECLFCHRATVGVVWQQDAHFLTVRHKFRGGREAPELEWLKSQEPYRKLADEVGFILGRRDLVRFLRRDEAGRFEILGVGMTPPKSGRPAQSALTGQPGWDRQKFSERCVGCHMTGVKPQTMRPFESFVGCETCHGPLNDQHTNGSAFMRLARKAKETPRVIASACGQCHLRGGRSRSTGRPFPNNFVSGDNLFKDFAFDFSGADDPRLNPMDAHIQRNIRDIVIYGQADLSCLSCHRLHPASTAIHKRRLRSDYCLVCHEAGSFKERKKYEVHSSVCEY